jgi:hypothetical protein
MDKELQAIRDAWDKNTGKGRDAARARKLADAYVAANPDKFTQLQGMSVQQCVKAAEVFRDSAMADDQWRVETWLLHRYEPQNIGGTVEAKVRII